MAVSTPAADTSALAASQDRNLTRRRVDPVTSDVSSLQRMADIAFTSNDDSTGWTRGIVRLLNPRDETVSIQTIRWQYRHFP